MSYRIELIRGDITKLAVDVIVNAANRSLLGGGGVDGAIHRVAGPRLLDVCRELKGCDTGQAKITPGFLLPAKYVIHTVGPVWYGGDNNEEELLASCYQNCMRLAFEHNCKTLAFPNISTGIYHFPKILAAKIATREVADFLEKHEFPMKVIFTCFDEENYLIYAEILSKMK